MQFDEDLNNFSVGGFGMIVHDEQLLLERQPERDEKVTAVARRTQIGGPVPVALSQLAQLGYPTTFWGIWAEDLAGAAIEAELRQRHLTFDPPRCRNARSTGTAHVWIDQSTGSRTVAAMPPVPHNDVDLTECDVASPTLMHLDGWGGERAIATAQRIVQAGGVISLDCGSAKPATEKLLSMATIVNAPAHFLEARCGHRDFDKGAKELLKLGPSIVTMTDGADGAGIWTREESHWLTPPPIRVIDSCGAGDVFCGGLLDGYLTAKTPRDMLESAIAAACWKIARLGNGPESLAGREELEGYRLEIFS